MDEITGTRMSVRGRTTVRRFWKMVVTGIHFQSCLPVCCRNVANLLCETIGIGKESYGTSFYSLNKIV